MKVCSRIGVSAGALVVVMATGAAAQTPKGKPATVTGRVVDNICMLGMGLKGEGHRECAIGCDKAGVRMALLDEKGNVLYTLMADKPFADPNEKIREHLERVVTIKGDLYDAPGGQKVLAIMKCSLPRPVRPPTRARQRIRAPPRTPAGRRSRWDPAKHLPRVRVQRIGIPVAATGLIDPIWAMLTDLPVRAWNRSRASASPCDRQPRRRPAGEGRRHRFRGISACRPGLSR